MVIWPWLVHPGIIHLILLAAAWTTTGQQFLSVLTGPLELLDTKSKRGHFRSFVKDCRHPYVAAPSELAYLRRKKKILVFRDYATRGSLRDLIHSANPVHPYNEKYVERGRPFPEKRLALYGRQILEGMHFLNNAGLRCVGLHCGNIVMLADDHCAISEFEQTALRMRGRLTSWLVDKKEPEVFAFGHVSSMQCQPAHAPTSEIRIGSSRKRWAAIDAGVVRDGDWGRGRCCRYDRNSAVPAVDPRGVAPHSAPAETGR